VPGARGRAYFWIVAPPKVPVFRSFRGPSSAPTEAWAMRNVGPDEKDPARRIAWWVDEVASGAEIVRTTAGISPMLAEALRFARKGLLVTVPPRFPPARDVLVAQAHALALGVELILEPYPPGPAQPPVPDDPSEKWLRWQVHLPVGEAFFAQAQAVLEAFNVFPLRHVSAPHLEAPVPLSSLAAAFKVPAGRSASFVVSPTERWTDGDHLLVASVGSRRDPYIVVAATLGPEALKNADVLHRLDWLTQTLIGVHGAFGGWLHPLPAAVWDNVPSPTSWDVGRRDRREVSVTTREDGWQRIDVETRPTHEHVAPTGVPLTAAAMMWLGQAQLAALDTAALEGFRSCEANHTFEGGRLIVLADPIHMADDTVPRQWEFRKAALLEEAVGRLASAPPPEAPAAPVAEETRHRLELSTMTHSAPVIERTARKVTFGGGESNVDAAMKLRFATRECTLSADGLVAKGSDGGERRLGFRDVASVFVRQLPSDPPFERALFVDLVPASAPPVRLMAATRVNYASLPGGAAPTALENLRRLARAVVQANTAVQLDPETKAFVDGKPPASFGGLGQFASYDSRFTG
jgi:hypothetical protein